LNARDHCHRSSNRPRTPCAGSRTCAISAISAWWPASSWNRAYQVLLGCLQRGVLVRYTGDILALSPPLIVEPAQIEQIFGTVAEVLRSIG
jgi:adenosylmethionine-8-amino-7-oxononanoate aminotransferase